MATSQQSVLKRPTRAPGATDVYGELLAFLSAPDTPQNRVFLLRWQAAEGHPGDLPGYYNPLNIIGSSLGSPGSFGVRQFGTPQYGAQATASFLVRNSSYSPIIHALRTGNPYTDARDAAAVNQAFAVWSGHAGDASKLSSSYLAILGNSPSTPELSSAQHSSAGLFGIPSVPSWLKPWLPKISPLPLPTAPLPGGPIPSIGTTPGSLPGLGSNPLGWIGSNWDRVLEVVGGFVLLLVGLVLLGRSLGLTPAGAPAMLAGGAIGEAIGRREYARQGSPEPATQERTRRPESVSASQEGDRQDARAERRRERALRPSNQTDEIPF